MTCNLNRLCELRGAGVMIENDLKSAITEELPPGTRVRWMHGRWCRDAVIVDHSYPRSLVRSYSGKEYWIDTWRIYHDGEAVPPTA
jgi:hypothetical protein